jgi:site-specific DNA recombinase
MSPSTPQLLRVALYARVSTEEQREGQTIDSQISELERFAASKDWQVAGVYKDDGWSGSMLGRPDLDRLRDDASKGRFALVLINDVDRLARDVSHLGVVKRDLERHKVQIVFRKLPAEKSPTYNLMVNILGSFAEFEREMIADRTRRGRRHKVEVRQQYLGSISSYGYRYLPKDKASDGEGRLEVIPEEATLIRQMFAWVDREGLSIRRVAERLTERGVPPKKGGSKWRTSSVRRILRNEMYAGVWYYNKHEACEPHRAMPRSGYKQLLKSSNRLRQVSDWLPVKLPEHLRIIEREQWQRVQKQIDGNRTFSSRNSRHQYLLRGLVNCGGCGARMVGDPCHGTFYYRCMRRCRRYPTIREGVLDDAIWKVMREAISKPQIIVKQLMRLQKQKADSRKAAPGELLEVEEALRAIGQEEERVVEAYRLNILSPDLLAREMEKLKARKAVLDARKASMTQEAALADGSEIHRSLKAYCQLARKRMRTFSKEERQRFLRLLIHEAIYTGSSVRIKGAIPIHTERADTAAPEDDPASEWQDSVVGGITATRISPRTTSSDRIGNTKLYPRGCNSVEGIPFQLSQLLPQRILPLHRQITSADLRRLIKEYPRATLHDLCDLLQKERSITMSTTAMCRLVKRHRIRRSPKPQIPFLRLVA